MRRALRQHKTDNLQFGAAGQPVHRQIPILNLVILPVAVCAPPRCGSIATARNSSDNRRFCATCGEFRPGAFASLSLILALLITPLIYNSVSMLDTVWRIPVIPTFLDQRPGIWAQDIWGQPLLMIGHTPLWFV